MSGRKRHAGDFTDRERIHVGAEGNGFVSAGLKPSADSVTVGRKDLAGQFLKHASHISGGLGKIKVKFRDLMEICWRYLRMRSNMRAMSLTKIEWAKHCCRLSKTDDRRA